RETDAVRSAAVLADKDQASAAKINTMADTFSKTGLAADLERVRTYASVRGIKETAMTSEETEASKLIPVRLKPDPPPAFGGGRGGRRTGRPRRRHQQAHGYGRQRG